MTPRVLVVGAGPAGVRAALRAADLGAPTTLVTRGAFGGMAATDGPVPVRTLAHAARLLRETAQCPRYGIALETPRLDYRRLLARVGEVVDEVRARSALRAELDALGVTVHEGAGTARFLDPHTVETESGLRLQAERIVLCTGGTSRRLSLPGFELTATHSDAWSLPAPPPSMLVIGAGGTGVQVASIFAAFGTRVQLLQAGPRILPGEDEDVSAAMADALRAVGVEVREDFGAITSFERVPSGVRMHFAKDGVPGSAEAALAVAAVGWVADAARLHLAAAGVETDERGRVAVNEQLQTSAPHVFAAGDVLGRRMLVPQALQDGFVAATNAVRGDGLTSEARANPSGSFTDPEYAQVGLTEAQARRAHDVVVALVRADEATRTIIDGRTAGFCKLLVDRATRTIVGCHVVGERAVEIVQVAAIALSTGMRVDDLAQVPLSFPTYTGMLGRAAALATRALNLPLRWQASAVEGF